MKRIKSFAMILAAATLLASCGGNKENPTPSESAVSSQSSEHSVSESSSESIVSSHSEESGSSVSSSESLLEFSEAKFESSTVTYDGKEHTIVVSGVPEGTTIVYSGNGPFVNAGTYSMSASLSKEGYRNKTLNATLTIAKADFSSLSLNSKSVDYDEQDHINDVRVEGTLPESASVIYTVKNSEGVEVDSAIEVGEYSVEAFISASNFNSKTLTAKLTIKAVQDALPVGVKDGVIYFANGLDDKHLYYYDQNAETPSVTYASPLVADDFFMHGGQLAMFSNALVSGSISSLSTTEVKNLYAKGLFSYACSDGTYLYVSKNGLTEAKSGLYKIDLSSDEPVETLLYTGKTYYVQYHGGNIYFANKDKYLCRISTSGGAASILSDASSGDEFKIKSLMIDNGSLYFNVDHLLGDYIEKIDIVAWTHKKLTSTQGKYLTVIGDYLYFSNNDLVTTAMSGKGVFRVPTAGGSIEKVIEEDNGINYVSYDKANNALVYVRSTDMHVIVHNLTSGSEKDLLQGFVAPEKTPLNTGGKNLFRNSYLYFLDMFEGKSLSRYRGGDKAILSNSKVVDFTFIGDDLYFNQVSYGANNDLFKANIASGEEPVKVSSLDLREIVDDGNHLYASKHNGAGVATSLVRMDYDGSNLVEFYSKGASNLRIEDNKLYFLDGSELNYIALSAITSTSENLSATTVSNAKHISKFEFNNGKIVYIYEEYLATQALRIASPSSMSSCIDLASASTDPVDFVIDGGYAYYFNDVATNSKDGFKKVSLSATADGTAQMIYATGGSTYWGNSLEIGNGYLYFLNRGEGTVGTMYGDAHTYCLNLTDSSATPEKIA